MHDKIEDCIGYIIKLKIWFGKISDTMIGILIQLEYNWKEVETFLYETEDFHLTEVW